MPHLFGRNIGKADLAQQVGDYSQIFGVDLVTCENGQERGNRVLRFRSGSGLSFDVLVDRAMDLAGMNYRGIPIGWNSPSGFRSPWLHEGDAEDGFGWFRSMSGMMNSCGLDHIHAPEQDSADHFHHPPRPKISHGLHGRIAFTPAQLTGYGSFWKGDRCYLYATGEIRQATVFGENLVLERRIEIEVGTDTVTYNDTVRNLGFDPTPHAYLWHVNLGWPLVQDRSRLIAPIEETLWKLREDESVEHGAMTQSPAHHPTTQQVFEHSVRADSNGTGRAAMVNDDFSQGEYVGLGLEIAWDAKTMPAFFQWQHFQSGNNVVALEPATTHAGQREDWRTRNEFKMLAHDEHVSYRLELTPHLGSSALKTLKTRLVGE